MVSKEHDVYRTARTQATNQEREGSSVTTGAKSKLFRGDCLNVMAAMDTDSVDLVLTSPPYEAARSYGIEFNLRGDDWVQWMLHRCHEMARICRGMVAIVCEGQTRQYNYSATPFLLMAELKKAGYALRKPLVFKRVGIPGSGGPDWFRNDWEPVVCFSRSAGRLAWSDNTACGHPPKWAPGGAMSNRTADGRRKNDRDKPEAKERRINQWGHSIDSGATIVAENGQVRSKGKRPSHRLGTGQDLKGKCASQPVLANPGNVIECNVGGGVMGSKLAHENEAPFPNKLAEFFVKSLCPPGGIVLDPFCGSGTTLAVAEREGRQWIGIDLRESQIQLSKRRIAEVRSISQVV